MHSANVKILPKVTLVSLFLTSCAHELGPGFESLHVARELGLGNCRVTHSMRRYETLDYADMIGNPNVAESPEWSRAMAMMQPGDELRYVDCPGGGNYFALFRGKSLLLNIGGGMLY